MKTSNARKIETTQNASRDLKEENRCCTCGDPGGLFFVIQVIPPWGEPFNAVVFAADAQLDELDEAHAMVPHLDKREVAAIFILRGLGFPEDLVLGAKCTVERFESEAEARGALARNRASKADLARVVNAPRN
jgi:hypothetical protein